MLRAALSSMLPPRCWMSSPRPSVVLQPLSVESDSMISVGNTMAITTSRVMRGELARVHALLDAATPREASAIRMRFGMDGYRPHSLKQIAEVLGMSRESVRKFLASALQAMGTSMAA